MQFLVFLYFVFFSLVCVSLTQGTEQKIRQKSYKCNHVLRCPITHIGLPALATLFFRPDAENSKLESFGRKICLRCADCLFSTVTYFEKNFLSEGDGRRLVWLSSNQRGANEEKHSWITTKYIVTSVMRNFQWLEFLRNTREESRP